MINHTEIIMSKIGVRGLVSLMGLVIIVCLAVLQMKSLAGLQELGLTVAALKRKEENYVEINMDKIGKGGELNRIAVYGEDIEILRTPKRERHLRAVDDIEPASANATMNKNDQHIHTPTGTDLGTLEDRIMTIMALRSTRFVFHTSQYGAPTLTASRIMHSCMVPNTTMRLFKLTNADALLYHNMSCAACRSKLRTSTFMLSARNRCFGDWHVEYQGCLMTGHNAQKASTDYICVDQAPEADPSGYRLEQGRQLYRVESICGSLACLQYMSGREHTCAVCSK